MKELTEEQQGQIADFKEFAKKCTTHNGSKVGEEFTTKRGLQGNIISICGVVKDFQQPKNPNRNPLEKEVENTIQDVPMEWNIITGGAFGNAGFSLVLESKA